MASGICCPWRLPRSTSTSSVGGQRVPLTCAKLSRGYPAPRLIGLAPDIAHRDQVVSSACGTPWVLGPTGEGGRDVCARPTGSRATPDLASRSELGSRLTPQALYPHSARPPMTPRNVERRSRFRQPCRRRRAWGRPRAVRDCRSPRAVRLRRGAFPIRGEPRGMTPALPA